MTGPTDLPKDADHRLEELKHGFFTSDLSVNEFPSGQGDRLPSSWIRDGFVDLSHGHPGASLEQEPRATKLTEAMYNALEGLAMTRMEEEAEELGADGVVGVRLDVNYYEWGNDAAEFIALGTAVKLRTARRGPQQTGQAFHLGSLRPGLLDHHADRLCAPGLGRWGTLREPHRPSGARPDAGIGRAERRASQLHPSPLRGAELAMTRMQDEGNRLGATGIVGVRLEEKTHQWGSHTIEFLSLGTA